MERNDQMKTLKTRRIRTAACCFALAAIVGTGGALAYFTDREEAANNFSIGKVSIELTEDNWDPENAVDITPGEEVKKNPAVKNDGINDSYVFLEVTVPTKNIVTAAENGTQNNGGKPAETQLFSYTPDSNWTLVTNAEVSDAIPEGAEISVDNKTAAFGQHAYDSTSGDGVVTYLYAYTGGSGTLKKLSANETTPELFPAVKFVNAIEGQGLEEMEPSILINAYSIQADFIDSGDGTIDGENADGKTDPANVWKILRTQKETGGK